MLFGRGGKDLSWAIVMSQMTENTEEKLSVPNPSVP